MFVTHNPSGQWSASHRSSESPTPVTHVQGRGEPTFEPPLPCRRVAMMRSLLAPYEQRPWAQTNWILVRLWRVSGAGAGPGLVLVPDRSCSQAGTGPGPVLVRSRSWSRAGPSLTLASVLQGCGFGYRYTRLPHLLKTKPEDANLPSLQSRCRQQEALSSSPGSGG